jgi:nuclear inhibitor of protein phosphatase 1
MEELEKSSSEKDGGLLGLPETETELENLTEFNTAHNRRIAMMGIPVEDAAHKKRPRKIRQLFSRIILK